MCRAACEANVKVAWLVRGDEGYGVRRASLGLMAGLSARGGEAQVLSLGAGPFVDDARREGHLARVLNLPWTAPGATRGLDRARRYWTQARLVQRNAPIIAELLRELRADVLHVRRSDLVWPGAAAAWAAGIPSLWQMPVIIGGNGRVDPRWAAFRVLCRRYRVTVVGNSKHTARTFGGPRALDDPLYPGTDARYFDPSVIQVSPQDLELPSDAVIALSVARLVPEKGPDRLIEALGLLEGEDRVHLVFVGGAPDPAYGEALRHAARHRGVEERCHFVGAVTDPRPYYAAADLVINGRVGAEPFGLAVVEAMMMKKPVLAVGEGGPGETIQDGETGWHLQDAAPASFAEGLRRALSERGRWREMGETARERAVARFGNEATVDRYLGILEGLV